MDLHLEARQFLHSARKGVLSTFSAKFPGYPFGSVAPFIVDHDGCPVILISTLAEHTRNIAAHPKVSLIVLDDSDDLQANARLTLLGDAVAADKNDAALRARYLRYLPQAEQYFDMHDFSFYRILPAQVRYIAGFGRMGWVEGKLIAAEGTQLASQEAGILAHMNSDHGHNLIAYCRHYKQLEASKAEMVGIDALGFDVRAHPAEEGGQPVVLRFHFDTPIHNAAEAREALVSMAHASRT